MIDIIATVIAACLFHVSLFDDCDCERHSFVRLITFVKTTVTNTPAIIKNAIFSKFTVPSSNEMGIISFSKFKNKEFVAFAGIGNPSNFFHLLKENNINIIKTYSFPDHHIYSQNDFDNSKVLLVNS